MHNGPEKLGEGVWYDPTVKGYALLDLTEAIDLATLPKTVIVNDVLLERKEEIHCTVVAARKAAHEDRQKEREIIDVVRGWLQTNVLSFDKFTGEVWVCAKANDEGETQTTIIAGVAISGLERLWEAVREVCPDFINPLVHITLFKSLNSKYGIGVHSPKQLTGLCTLRKDLAPLVLPVGAASPDAAV